LYIENQNNNGANTMDINNVKLISNHTNSGSRPE